MRRGWTRGRRGRGVGRRSGRCRCRAGRAVAALGVAASARLAARCLEEGERGGGQGGTDRGRRGGGEAETLARNPNPNPDPNYGAHLCPGSETLCQVPSRSKVQRVESWTGGAVVWNALAFGVFSCTRLLFRLILRPRSSVHLCTVAPVHLFTCGAHGGRRGQSGACPGHESRGRKSRKSKRADGRDRLRVSDQPVTGKRWSGGCGPCCRVARHGAW